MDQEEHLSHPPPGEVLKPEVLPPIPEETGLARVDDVVYSFTLPEGNSPDAIRQRVKLLKEITERCYMRLARDLWEVYHTKLYLQYGYSTFDDYVASDVGISKDRSYKLRRIFSVLVRKCDIRPSEIEAIERSRVEMILSVVDRNNAREWLDAAKTLPYKELRNKLTREQVRRRGPVPGATKPDKPETTTPVRLACEASPDSEQARVEVYRQRTFRLPEDSDTLLDEALSVAARVTGSHSDSFNLTCIAQQFLAHNLTVEGKDDGRRGYFQRWMEEIYGGWFLHVRNDEAWAVLADAVEKHPHLFGKSEREESDVPDEHEGQDSDGGEEAA